MDRCFINDIRGKFFKRLEDSEILSSWSKKRSSGSVDFEIVKESECKGQNLASGIGTKTFGSDM